MCYRTCPYCGANLDPGERCDCQTGAEESSQDDNKKAAMPASTAANPLSKGDPN